MNQHSATPGRPAIRALLFFRITVALLAMLLLAGAAAALLLVFEAADINRSGGWGWLLVAGIYVVAIFVVCSACALCTAVDCFFIEERFNTPEIREENRNQVEILLRGETIDVEIREIPARELVEIMKIQKANPASVVRYSLVPRMTLRIRQEVLNGRVGRNFLIGEQNGKWYIITMAGHTS